MSVNALTRSFGRRIKRIEISKVRPETSAFVPFHKYQLSKYSLTGECFDRQLSGILGLKELHFLLFYIHSSLIRSRLPTSLAARNKAKVKRMYSQVEHRLISKEGSCAFFIFLKGKSSFKSQ